MSSSAVRASEDSTYLIRLCLGACLPGWCRDSGWCSECQCQGVMARAHSPAISNSVDFLQKNAARLRLLQQRKTHITNSPSPTLDVCITTEPRQLQTKQTTAWRSPSLRPLLARQQSSHTMSTSL